MPSFKRKFLLPFFLSTQDHAIVQNLRDLPLVVELRKDWASVVLTDIQFTLFQVVPCNNDEIASSGLVGCGLVPSDWTVPVVLQKATQAIGLSFFNCSYEDVSSHKMSCDLSSFECDLALKDRRGALPRIAMTSYGLHLTAANPNFLFTNLEVIMTLDCSGEAYGV